MKIRYLVGIGSGRKLKRNVPKDIKHLVDKTAWVKSVGNLSVKELKEQANIFSVKTDGEIRRFRSMLLAGDQAEDNLNSLLNLSEVRVEQLAIIYFQDCYRKCEEEQAFFVSAHDARHTEILADAAEDWQAAYDAVIGDVVSTDLAVLKFLREQSVISKKQQQQLIKDGWPVSLANHRNFQKLCRLLEHADLELAHIRLEALRTGVIPSIGNDRFRLSLSATAEINSNPNAKTVKELIDLFRSQKKDSVSVSRYSQFEIPARALVEHFGDDYPLSRITRESCRELVSFLPKIPPYATQHFGGLSLADAAKAYEKREGAPANRYSEADKHLQVISKIFENALAEGWLDTNPWNGLRVAIPPGSKKKYKTKGETYEPLTIADLNGIFGDKQFVSPVKMESSDLKSQARLETPHMYWTPLMALWTGMRMNEILQLERSDVKETDNGINYISVTDEVTGDYGAGEFEKRLKTKQSVRDIPIHPTLIKLGFLEFVATVSHGRLFPEARQGASGKPSDIYTKRFATLLKRVGVWQPRRKVFHSFRNTFNDALREANVPVEIREAINGWNSQRSMDSKYGKGHKIERLHEELSKVSYPGLSLDHLMQVTELEEGIEKPLAHEN